MKELLWPTHWFRYETVTIGNKKVNNRTRWRLYYRILLGYEFVENHYQLIAVDLGRQKELDADLKAI